MYENEQFDLWGVPECEEIIHGDHSRIAEAVAEDGIGITQILFDSLHTATPQWIWLVFVEFNQHNNILLIASNPKACAEEFDDDLTENKLIQGVIRVTDTATSATSC